MTDWEKTLWGNPEKEEECLGWHDLENGQKSFS